MWRPLAELADARLAKLMRLKLAAEVGLTVPPTVWLPAERVAAVGGDLGVAPSAAGWVVRSAAPDEDAEAGAGGSRAGHYASLHLAADADEATRRDALAQVAASMARDGRARGAVFVEPVIVAERAGVAFFDGFWFEASEAPGDNVALTHGDARGAVRRGHVAPGDAFSAFLAAARRACGGRGAVDLEYAGSGDAFTLLQVRPAHFEVRRNPTLSMANHREILGEVPSPWITSVLERAGASVIGWFAAADPAVAAWGERYAIVVHGRPWMNFSFFYRLMDHWGLPRRWVTAGVGGAAADEHGTGERLAFGRLRAGPLIRLQARGVARIARIATLLARVRAEVEAARTLPELFRANAAAMDFAVTTNFAIGGFLTGWARLRRPLGLAAGGPLVTAAMMHAFDRLRALPEGERAAGLERWLERHGHRGPLESDPARPRFAEMRERLLAELAMGGSARPEPPPSAPWRDWAFFPDRLRERFRDELMHLWRIIRARALMLGRDAQQSGLLAEREDVFFLGAADLEAPQAEWRARVATARERHAQHAALLLPVTADRDSLEAATAPPAGGDALRGVGIGSGVVRGRVVRARELDEVLGRTTDGGSPACILVVPSLEPSWAVVFPRFSAVVSELGGELSHAAILLRESRQRAVVDCRGAFAGLADGEPIEVDVERGTVTRLG